MAHQIKWNRQVLDKFIELGVLSDLDVKIMETRVKEWTISKQAREFGYSESMIKKRIAKLKQIYDEVQPLAPDILPLRISSKIEDYMDTH